VALLHFSNKEISDTYHVSVSTVYNWIESAKQGKLELDLVDHNGRPYVRNSNANIEALKQLVKERNKFRNRLAIKEVSPRPEFYDVYNEAQIYDIAKNLETYHEIPREYNYFDGGADNWDRYTRRLASEKTPNLLTQTIDLLEINSNYLDVLLSRYKRVNIVDIGVGNAMPVRKLLEHLLKRGKLGRYLAIDISPEMLRIAKANIHEWFGGRVDFEDYEADINYDRFSTLLAEDYLKGSNDTVNVILFLGGTPYNFREPDKAFSIIHDSMRLNDILVYSDKLDAEATRNFFDFNAESDDTPLADNHRFIFDLLNIDKSLYEVERGFDEKLHQRFIRVKLKSALRIKFGFQEGQQTLEFNKGERILLWRAWDMTARGITEQLDRNGFYTLATSQTSDREYVLTFAGIKRS
jgi:uncharacterized SAM-dependent methyltransferase